MADIQSFKNILHFHSVAKWFTLIKSPYKFNFVNFVTCSRIVKTFFYMEDFVQLEQIGSYLRSIALYCAL